MREMKGNISKMKKFSIVMAGVIALIISIIMCAAQVVHASETESEVGTVNNVADSSTGNWPIDLTKNDCSIDLSLVYKKDGKTQPLNGGSLALYTVATVKEENGYVYDVSAGQFASVSGVDKIPAMTSADLDRENASIAKTLEGAVSTLKAEPQALAEISSGKASFTGLKAGLYLVAQKKNSDGDRKINAFLVSIPDSNGNYNLKAAPKNGIVSPSTPTPTPTPKLTPIPTITPKITTPPRKTVTTTVRKTSVLPKTGQEWLPVCAFAVIGIVLIAAGRKAIR